jgi:hypothetical protein
VTDTARLGTGATYGASEWRYPVEYIRIEFGGVQRGLGKQPILRHGEFKSPESHGSTAVRARRRAGNDDLGTELPDAMFLGARCEQRPLCHFLA